MKNILFLMLTVCVGVNAADQKPLVINATTGRTEQIQAANTLSVPGAMDVNGYAAIGNAATPSSFIALYVQDSHTGDAVYRGLRVETTHVVPVAGASTGIDVLNYTSGANNSDHSVGVQARPQHGSSGALNDLYGVFSTVGALNGSGLVTNAYSLYSAIPSKSGTASITNAYGLYVEAVTGIGSTANWGIFSGGTNSLNTLYVPTLTSGRVPLVTTGGQVVDNAQLTYSSSGRIVNIGDGTLSSGSYVQIQAASAQERQVVFNTGTGNRWGVGVQTGAESGSNAGANFAFSAYSDASALIDQPIVITRAATGTITLNRTLTATKAIMSGVFALTDAATIATDATNGNEFTVTLGGNRTMGAPTNPVDGQKILYRLTQDGTGSRTMAWNAVFAFSSSLPSPTLTTTAGGIDYIAFVYSSASSKWHCLAYTLGF